MEIDLHTAFKRMRELTAAGASFKLEFMKLNGELKVVNKAVLRAGYEKEFSARGKFLIAYEDLDTEQMRQFHRSLLLKLNDIKIKR